MAGCRQSTLSNRESTFYNYYYYYCYYYYYYYYYYYCNESH